MFTISISLYLSLALLQTHLALLSASPPSFIQSICHYFGTFLGSTIIIIIPDRYHQQAAAFQTNNTRLAHASLSTSRSLWHVKVRREEEVVVGARLHCRPFNDTGDTVFSSLPLPLGGVVSIRPQAYFHKQHIFRSSVQKKGHPLSTT